MAATEPVTPHHLPEHAAQPFHGQGTPKERQRVSPVWMIASLGLEIALGVFLAAVVGIERVLPVAIILTVFAALVIAMTLWVAAMPVHHLGSGLVMLAMAAGLCIVAGVYVKSSERVFDTMPIVTKSTRAKGGWSTQKHQPPPSDEVIFGDPRLR